eukprot:jgi/Antlo1/14/1892
MKIEVEKSALMFFRRHCFAHPYAFRGSQTAFHIRHNQVLCLCVQHDAVDIDNSSGAFACSIRCLGRDANLQSCCGLGTPRR